MHNICPLKAAPPPAPDISQVACYKICSVRMGDSAASGEAEVEPEVAGLIPENGAGSPEGSEHGGKVPVSEVPTEEIENLGQVGIMMVPSSSLNMLPASRQLCPALPTCSLLCIVSSHTNSTPSDVLNNAQRWMCFCIGAALPARSLQCLP